MFQIEDDKYILSSYFCCKNVLNASLFLFFVSYVDFGSEGGDEYAVMKRLWNTGVEGWGICARYYL